MSVHLSLLTAAVPFAITCTGTETTDDGRWRPEEKSRTITYIVDEAAGTLSEFFARTHSIVDICEEWKGVCSVKIDEKVIDLKADQPRGTDMRLILIFRESGTASDMGTWGGVLNTSFIGSCEKAEVPPAPPPGPKF